MKFPSGRRLASLSLFLGVSPAAYAVAMQSVAMVVPAPVAGAAYVGPMIASTVLNMELSLAPSSRAAFEAARSSLEARAVWARSPPPRSACSSRR